MSLPSERFPDAEWKRQAARQLNPILSGYPYPELAADPSGVRGGYTYYNSTTGKVRTYNGVTAAWADHY